MIQPGLGELKPDVVSLQEAIKTADVDSAADVLGSGFNLVFQSDPEPDGQTAALASRWPIIAVHELDQHLTERIDSGRRLLRHRTWARRSRTRHGEPEPASAI